MAAVTERSIRLPILEPASGVERFPAGSSGEGTPADRLLQVGELAKAAGKTVRAIHHYEEIGLLKPDARSKGRFRLYDPSAVTRVRWISKLHAVVAAWESAPTAGQAMSQVRGMYRERLEETRAQLARLSELERELEASISYLDTCDACDPNVLANVLPPRDEQPAAACEACQRREREAEPDLVAGIVS